MARATKRAPSKTPPKAGASRTAKGSSAKKVAAKGAAKAKAAKPAKAKAAPKKVAVKKPAAKKPAPKKPAAKKTAAKKTAAKAAPSTKAASTKKTTAPTPKPAAKRAAAKSAAPAKASKAPEAPAKVKPKKKPKPEVTPREIAKIKDGLIAQREELMKEYADLEEGSLLTSQSESSGEASFDEEYADAGSYTFEREKELSIGNNIRDLLDKVEQALRKIEAGTYGICDNCGNPIAKARVQALPYTSLCLSCKQLDERTR